MAAGQGGEDGSRMDHADWLPAVGDGYEHVIWIAQITVCQVYAAIAVRPGRGDVEYFYRQTNIISAP